MTSQNSSVITKKTSGLFGTGFLSGLTKDYKIFITLLKGRKQEALHNYQKEINTKENEDNGFVYPFKNDVYKFDTNYLGDLILLQEVNLRKLLVTALSKQSLQGLKFNEILPLEAKRVLNSSLCVVIRYKRLYDLFFRASTVRQKGLDMFDSNRWYLHDEKTSKEYKKKYELPSVEQLETIVKYSLDIPFCLNILFGLNGLKQFNTKGEMLENDSKTEYRPKGGDYKIVLGESKKKTIYLNKDGRIKDIGGIEYDVVGLSVQQFAQSDVNSREQDPNELVVDIMKHKDTVSTFMDFVEHRRFGTEYLPNGDNWDLKWFAQDERLYQQFKLKFAVKLPEKIKSCPCANKMKSRRQVIELPPYNP
jgi:hypothetical protein